jgi:hypothetical protein
MNRLLGLVIFALAGCGGGGSSAPPALPEVALVVEVVKSSPISINVPLSVTGGGDPFGGNASGNAVIDFDNDGLKDLLLPPGYYNAFPELPVIALRQTSGGFVNVTAQLFPSGAPTTGLARAPLVADFNGDGREDYFTADTGLEVRDSAGNFPLSQNRLFLSSAAGSYSASLVPTHAFNHGSCMGDINRDGRIDIVVTPLSPPKTYGLMNSANGFVFDRTMMPPELLNYTLPKDFNPSSCGIGDVNADGWPDLVASAYGDGVASGHPDAPFPTGTRIFLNDKSGKFMPAAHQLPRPPGSDWGSTSIQLADFDANGLTDVLVAYEGPTGWALQLWMQGPADQFVDRTIAAFGSYQTDVGFWRETDIGDFNGDGSVDIYLRGLGMPGSKTYAEQLRSQILLNDGSGQFHRSAKPLTLSQSTQPPFLIVESAKAGVLTLVGYDLAVSNNAYTQITPVLLRIKFD